MAGFVRRGGRSEEFAIFFPSIGMAGCWVVKEIVDVEVEDQFSRYNDFGSC
jgi:hypothetical protein